MKAGKMKSDKNIISKAEFAHQVKAALSSLWLGRYQLCALQLEATALKIRKLGESEK